MLTKYVQKWRENQWGVDKIRSHWWWNLTTYIGNIHAILGPTWLTKIVFFLIECQNGNPQYGKDKTYGFPIWNFFPSIYQGIFLIGCQYGNPQYGKDKDIWIPNMDFLTFHLPGKSYKAILSLTGSVRNSSCLQHAEQRDLSDNDGKFWMYLSLMEANRSFNDFNGYVIISIVLFGLLTLIGLLREFCLLALNGRSLLP